MGIRSNYRVILFIFMVLIIGFAGAQPDILWAKAIGDSTGYYISSDLSLDGGFILTGPAQDSLVRIVRVDSGGDTVWTDAMEIGDFSSDHSSVKATSDGGYLLATGGDPWLVRYDDNGAKVWEKAFSDLDISSVGAFNGYIFAAIVELNDGSFVFSGFYGYSDYRYPYFVKTTSSGTVTWEKSISSGYAWSITKTSSGHLVATGNFTEGISGEYGPGLLKLSTDGDSLSVNVFRDTNTGSNPSNSRYELYDIEETSDNGFIMAGRKLDSLNVDNYYVVMANSSGELVWENTYANGYTGEARFVTQVDTCYMVSGLGFEEVTENIKLWTLCLSSSGDTLWTSGLGLPGNNGAFDCVKISAGEYLFAGIASYSFEPWRSNGLLVRLSFNGAPVGITPELPSRFSLEQNFPNPFNPVTTIHYTLPATAEVNVTIYDLLGNVVENLVSGTQSAGTKSVEWDASSTASGVYFYRIEYDGVSHTRKMLLLK